MAPIEYQGIIIEQKNIVILHYLLKPLSITYKQIEMRSTAPLTKSIACKSLLKKTELPYPTMQ